MTTFLRSIVDRFRNLFVTQAALDLEAEIVAHRAENQAMLLRKAEQYEREGLQGIAHFIRKQAEALDADQPLATLTPALRHWQNDDPPRSALAAVTDDLPNPKAIAIKKRRS